MPGREHEEYNTRQFSYIEVTRLFANVRHLDLHWTPLAETDVRLRCLEDAAENMATIQSDAIVIILISTIHNPAYVVSDQQKVDQLGLILRQIQSPLVHTFCLDFDKAVSFHTSESGPLWSSFANALKSCRLPGVKRIWLSLQYMPMTNRKIAIDFCVSRSQCPACPVS
jgi:hypothetical protein